MLFLPLDSPGDQHPPPFLPTPLPALHTLHILTTWRLVTSQKRPVRFIQGDKQMHTNLVILYLMLASQILLKTYFPLDNKSNYVQSFCTASSACKNWELWRVLKPATSRVPAFEEDCILPDQRSELQTQHIQWHRTWLLFFWPKNVCFIVDINFWCI